MPVAALFGFSGTTDTAISKSQVQIPLVPGYYMPFTLGVGEYAYAYLMAGCIVEIVKITDLSGDTLTVVRGQSGTDSQAFPRYSSIFYAKSYAEYDELLPYGAPPQLLPNGAVEVDGLNVHIDELAIAGVDFLGNSLTGEVNAVGCCDTPGLVAPTPENVTDALSITGDAPNTSTSAAIADYFYPYITAGGTAPRQVTVVASVLPPGLEISLIGIVTGRATTPGSYTFTLRVTDYWGATDELEDTIVVTSHMSMFGNAPDSVVNVAGYSYNYSSANGTPPYTYAVTGGAFPTGLSMDAAGLLTGTPTVVGVYTVNLSSTDDDGNVATHTDIIEITAVPGGGTTEERWYATSTLATCGSSFTNALHTRVPVGGWFSGGWIAHASTPHSLSAIGQRLIGIRKELGPVYSDNYGTTWQLGTWTGPAPIHADPIHVADGKAYTPGIVQVTIDEDAGSSSKPREVYWISTDGATWAQIKPNRGRIYDLSGIMSSAFIDPTDPDADNPYGHPEIKKRLARIGIRVARRLLGKTFLGLQLSKAMSAREILYIDEGPPRVIHYVPEANRFGGIIWKTTDGAGTTLDGPDTWQGGAVAPFSNICALGNTLVVAGDTYEIEESDDGSMMPRNVLGYSTDGGTTFQQATYNGLTPFKVEPRTLTVMGGRVFVIGYTGGGGNIAMRVYYSANGQAWDNQAPIEIVSAATAFPYNITAAYAGSNIVRGVGKYLNSVAYWDHLIASREAVAAGQSGAQFNDIVRIPNVPVP